MINWRTKVSKQSQTISKVFFKSEQIHYHAASIILHDRNIFNFD